MTPVPGSVVSTRSRRSAIASVPSATTTIPAWIELPIPTPPPWWTLTHVAPAATLTSAFRIGQSAIASDHDRRGHRPGANELVDGTPRFRAIAVAEPADPRREPLERHASRRQREPS